MLNLKRRISSSKGFTLIELLIVIAILGVMAAVVLVAINPTEQLAKSRDSGRITTLSSIGHVIQQYYVSQNALPPTASWNTAIAGSLATTISLPAGVPAANDCTGAANNRVAYGNGFICFVWSGTTNFLVWTALESDNSQVKANGANPGVKCVTTSAGTYAYVVYDSSLGKTGLKCLAPATAPTIGGTLY